MVLSLLSQAAKGLASKVLAFDNTAVPTDQLNTLNDLMTKHQLKFSESDNLSDTLAYLKKKHLVESVTITREDGSMIVSSEGNGFHEAITGAAMLNYVKSELPDSKSILVKGKDSWTMIIPHEKKIYIVKATSNLEHLELRALAKEIEHYLKKAG